jgi:predicted small integral membrane protein
MMMMMRMRRIRIIIIMVKIQLTQLMGIIELYHEMFVFRKYQVLSTPTIFPYILIYKSIK